MKNFNDKNEIIKQYGTANNLNSRVKLHQLFSTNKQGWTSWVFQNYSLRKNHKILELGCGNGSLWRANEGNIPCNVKLVLSDFSEGMLNSAKENTMGMEFIEYQVIDAQNIPYNDNVFDVVIANHMLYHVSDINKALSEISRVIKPNGVFYATTIGENNIKEMIDILNDFDSAIDFAQKSVTDAFGLESGQKILSNYFCTVELKRYIDSLHITEAQPLVDYVLSSQGIGNVNKIIVGEKVAEFEMYISELLSEKGFIDISKDAGIFLSTNPK